MAIGDIINIDNTNLLILDEIDGNPFVICLDTGIETEFGGKGDYQISVLRKKMEKWIASKNFKAVPRVINLTAAMDDTNHVNLVVDVAPLSFDEYCKYRKIIYPHNKNWFWLLNKWDSNPTRVCFVISDGSANSNGYHSSSGLAPAFILDKDSIKKKTTLSDFTTEELLSEIAKRTK